MPQDILVHVGTTDWEGGGTICTVKKVFVHPNYTNPMIANDVALLQLSNSVTFGQNMQPIQLGTTLPSTGATLFAPGGWLTTYTNGIPAIDLEEVEVSRIGNAICQLQLSNSITFDKTGSMLCTSGVQGMDSSQGNSGSPLYGMEGDVEVLVGVLSYARAGKPAVYTNVASVRPWIERTIFYNNLYFEIPV